MQFTSIFPNRKFYNILMGIKKESNPLYLKNKEEIQRRLEALHFKSKYGLEPTLAAFKISKRTFYNWQKMIIEGRGKKISLAPKSKRPLNLRKSKIEHWYELKILELRKNYQRMGKEKIKYFLDEICEENNKAKISVSSIGRIIKKLKDKQMLPTYVKYSINARTGNLIERKPRKKRKKERRGKYVPEKAGELVQIDCITKFLNGIKRYVISGIDYKTGFAFSYGYKTLSSSSATDFLKKFIEISPFEIKNIQTDNGQEFHKYFDEYISKKTKIKHLWNYARHPQQNGKIERFNRTIQYEFIDFNEDVMAYDLNDFNLKLMEWLLFYNTKRPHYSCQINNSQNPPMKYVLFLLKLNNENTEKCNMLWTYTSIVSLMECNMCLNLCREWYFFS